MSKLERGQVSFDRLIPMKTCHDIRRWRGCPQCGKLGGKESMIQTGVDFWHGRCFAKKFGMERLLEMPHDQVTRLSLGDLGARLMGQLLDGVAAGAKR